MSHYSRCCSAFSRTNRCVQILTYLLYVAKQYDFLPTKAGAKKGGTRRDALAPYPWSGRASWCLGDRGLPYRNVVSVAPQARKYWFDTDYTEVQSTCCRLAFLALPTLYAEPGLCNGMVSFLPSVCPPVPFVRSFVCPDISPQQQTRCCCCCCCCCC